MGVKRETNKNDTTKVDTCQIFTGGSRKNNWRLLKQQYFLSIVSYGYWVDSVDDKKIESVYITNNEHKFINYLYG